jgi:amino acid transporter
MESKKHTPSEEVSQRGTLGTFGGVFTPSVLTILGIILFLRLGYVVGNAGLARALMIIGLANAISVLTSISLSAVSTNLRVKGGGDYYLISRTLGLEFGGAIGIVLFLAQSVSIAFYCMGFGEALTAMLPNDFNLYPQIIAAMAVSFLFVLAWLGADWATRFQYVVMALLVLALLSFFTGGSAGWNAEMFARNWTTATAGPFWILFAIFFPAVTGFTQGVSMSGDLRDPGRSLPLGTFLAVGISIVVYFSVAIIFAGALPNSILASNYGAMRQVARFGFLIDAGVIAATLSSAMASFLGAPRILQSLAADRIIPFLNPFSKGHGPQENPRRGVLLSAFIAFVTIGLGNLNVIAPVVSMFFLISYGLLNYATFYEARSGSPAFRPRFRWFDYRLSFLGFIACFGAMLAIDPMAGIVAISVLFGIFQYLRRTAGPARWADSRRSFHLQRVRENLLAASRETEHPRDWRPQILAFSDDSHRRKQLLTFSSWLQGNSGLTTAVRILIGNGLKMLRLREEAEDELKKDIQELDLAAFPLVVVAPDIQVGVQTLVQGFGMGPIRANTVLLNWFEELPKGILGLKEISYARNLRTAFRLGCNIVVLDAKDEKWEALESIPSENRRIDVWWRGDSTSHLMLLLAYIIKQSEPWRNAVIRVMSADSEEESERTIEGLKNTLDDIRIEAEPEVIVKPDTDTVIQYSADTSLVLLPFRIAGNQLMCIFGGALDKLLPSLPIVAMILAAEDIDLDAEPEEGKAGEMAVALDALADAKQKAEKAEKDAADAADALAESEKALSSAQASTGPGADREAMGRIEKAIKQVEEARTSAEKAARRSAKAKAKAEDMAREAEALGASPPQEKEEDAET